MSSPILLVEPVARGRAGVATALERSGHEVTSIADLAAAPAAAASHQLVILDADDLGAQAELAEKIRAQHGQAVSILCVAEADDLEGRIRLLEAGADDVIARPFDARELEARVEALLLRQRRTRAGARGGSEEGSSVVHTVACLGPKGGSGTTTLAVNLAAWAARRQPDRVLLIDLDLQWGQVATFLDLDPRHTISDLVRDDAALSDPEHLRSHLVRHESGLWILPAPPSPADAEAIKAQHVEALLRTAREAFDTIVLDLGSWLDERSIAAMDLSDSLVVPAVPEVTALRPVALLISWLRDSHSLQVDRLSVVVNQLAAKPLVARTQVETTLGVPVAAELPHHPSDYSVAANTGRPVVLASSGSRAGKALAEMAATLLGSSRASRSGRGPFGRLRR